MNQSSRANHSLDVPRSNCSHSLQRWRILPTIATSCALACALAAQLPPAFGQPFDDLPGMEDAFDAGAPTMEMGGGSFFSQDLGTLLRLRYNTESYGQDRRGNFDIGTMQVQSFEDAIAFFDGQATLNDVNGVGYNLGVGFRWLHWSPFPIEPERITGFSFWTDGTSTEAGNFFPQVGLSFESLGDRWDLRINGYIPVGQKSQLGEFIPTGNVDYSGNFLVEEALADRNTSFYVAEAEVAARLLSDRDAWAFAGPYTLVNDDQDTAGYRAGFRGYAYPDLLLQIAVTDDDIFKTKAAFQVTWFVGRTRTNFQPACGLADRMREPVMRNDYVALQRTKEVGGEPLTNTDGELIRIVHVDSDAAAGGDGTFERPLNNVGDVEANSIVDDIVLMWSESIFANQNTLVLRDNQRLLGEGNGEIFTVTTQQRGVVVLPETSPGARDLARPIIQGTTGAGAVQLADANEVANFNIDGSGSAAGAHGIFSPTGGAGNPNIHDLDISNVEGTGIQFTPLTKTDPNDATRMIVAGNVTIDDVNFDDMAGVEIDINSFTTTDVTSANVTLQETIAISDVESQNGNDIGIWLRNTHDNGTSTTRITTITNYVNGMSGAANAGSGGGNVNTGVLVFEGSDPDEFEGNVTLTNIDIFNNEGYAVYMSNVSSDSATTITSGNGLTWNGEGGDAGGLAFNNFNGTFTGNSSTLSQGTLSGLLVTGDTGGTITLNNTVTFDANDPGMDEAVINVGPNGTDNFTGDLTVAGAITNHDTGRLVSIQRVTDAGATVTLNGDMTDVPNANSEGIFIGNNTNGTILFGGELNINTTGFNGIEIVGNGAGTDISFGDEVNITTDGAGAIGFTATGGGILTASATTNTVTTNGSAGIIIEGMEITTAGVNFSKVNVDGSPDNAIRLMDNTDGPILLGTLGEAPGDSGVIQNTVLDAIVIDNSDNVTISALEINTTANTTGVWVNKTTNGTQTVNLNDLEINGGEIGVEVTGNNTATATLNMTINDSTINDPTEFGLSFTDIDAGTIAVNGTTIDGDEANAGAVGVQIVDSDATFTFDAATMVQNFAEFEVEIDGGAGNVTYNGEIANAATSGRSVHILDRSGGSVQFSSTSMIDDDALGILVENNTGGSISFLGTNDLDTAAAATEAVMVDNNTGATITFSGLNINTAAGSSTRGLVAQDGGTLSVTGATNEIDTENGTGLDITDMTIGSVDLASVTVDGGTGPVNAILLENLTGGQVEIGTSTGADGSGGELTSTGDAIVITDAANVSLHDIDIMSAGGNAISITKSTTASMTVAMDNVDVDNATGDGVNLAVSNSGQVNLTSSGSDFTTIGGEAIDIMANGTANDVNVTVGTLVASADIVATTANNAALDFRLSNSTVNGSTTMNLNSAGNFDMLIENSLLTATGTDNTVALLFGNNSQDADVIIRNNTTFDANDGAAMLVTATGTNAEIDFELSGNDLNNSNGAQQTVDVEVTGGAEFNATVVNNDITNSGGDELYMLSDGSSTRLDLNLDNNDAGGGGVYHLETANQGVPTVDFNFGVVDLASADGNNVGTINFDPAQNEFENISDVPTPVLP